MKYLFFIQITIFISLLSCSKENDPEPDPGTDPGTEEPTPNPEPEAPEGTLTLGGLFWDTENTFDYCSFADALEEAKKQGKRVPTKEEWKALAEEGSAWDDELKGRWYGKDSELKDKSEESVFLPALGSYSHKSDSYIEIGKAGIYWSLPEYNGRGYTAGFRSTVEISHVLASEGHGYPLRLVQDK